MPRQLAIAIGVGRVAGPGGSALPLLSGARDGARQFAAWAQSQGFDVRLFVDSDLQPISLAEIREAVMEAVDIGYLQRLFVFFAGHGIEGDGDDIWLLSDAAGTRDEAIDVTDSVRDAKRTGIPHVAFFGDACRIQDPAMGRVDSRSIFSPTNAVGTYQEIDQFYATASGDRAWEYRPADSSRPAYGIYTDCLLRALNGQAPSAVVSVPDGDARVAVVSHSLKRYLFDVVPLESSTLVNKTQIPIQRLTPTGSRMSSNGYPSRHGTRPPTRARWDLRPTCLSNRRRAMARP